MQTQCIEFKSKVPKWATEVTDGYVKVKDFALQFAV